MKMMLELVFYNRSTLLEGPIWDSFNNFIVCVSIEQSCIYQINVCSGQVNTIPTDGPVGCVVQVSPSEYWSAEKGGIYEINIIDGNRKKLIHPEFNPKMRYNDGKLDPKGRFIFGSMLLDDYNTFGMGKLFSFDGDKFKILIDGVTISNGIAFSNDAKYMYYIDTPTKVVKKYNYDIITGEITFNSKVITFNGEGLPDGMCIDIDNMLWIAEWNGGKVCKWDPNTGEKLIEINLPCKNVTSCCLAGEDLKYLYITTAKTEYNDELLAGGLFRLKIR
jgi:sugar lactone lactonase YvrE